MSNLKHGFCSTNIDINTDSRLLSQSDLTQDELCLAESYLHGDTVTDPLAAHAAAKKVYTAGSLKYPTLFSKAEYYVTKTIDYETLEKLTKYLKPG